MKTVFVSGHFNIIHPGHLRLLKFAKSCGEKLIVGLESDRMAGEAAYIKQGLRFEGLKSFDWIDEIIIIDNDLKKFLLDLKPDIIVKGKEHELKFNQEEEIVNLYGGKLIFGSGEKLFSSKELIKREFFTQQQKTIYNPKEYFLRHNLKGIDLVERVNNFSKLKICVIGDIIIDEYVDCHPLGMSQEDSTVVMRPVNSKKYLGGAGIVSAHAACLGAEVNFISVSGNDDTRKFTLNKLNDYKVKSKIFIDENRPTTLKKRYRSNGKSLFRTSYLHQDEIPLSIQKLILVHLEELIDDIDLLVFSDFNYGCLPKGMIGDIEKLTQKKKIFIVADSQSSSQIGDISRFKNMDLITPTEHEARISLRNNQSGLVVLAEDLKKISKAKNILLKMGEEGLLIHANKNHYPKWFTDKIYALNSNPKDVSGAGDSLFITAAMTLASGGNIWEAAGLGSIAAAVQVSRVGNTPLIKKDIISHI